MPSVDCGAWAQVLPSSEPCWLILPKQLGTVHPLCCRPCVCILFRCPVARVGPLLVLLLVISFLKCFQHPESFVLFWTAVHARYMPLFWVLGSSPSGPSSGFWCPGLLVCMWQEWGFGLMALRWVLLPCTPWAGVQAGSPGWNVLPSSGRTLQLCPLPSAWSLDGLL